MRRLRLQAGFTQALLAKAARSDPATISRYESGQRSPTLAMLDRLASAVGLRVVVTFESTEPEPDHAATTAPASPKRPPTDQLWTL